jgi:hypothetical protein
VLAFRRRNSYTAALVVAIRFGGVNIKAIYLVHCPKIRRIELISKGSGCFKSNISQHWEKLGKKELTNPKIRKGVMKLRNGAVKKVNIAHKGAMKFDTIKTDSVKKILK